MNRVMVFRPDTCISLCATIEANVDNQKLSDADFRQFVRNSLPAAKVDPRHCCVHLVPHEYYCPICKA